MVHKNDLTLHDCLLTSTAAAWVLSTARTAIFIICNIQHTLKLTNKVKEYLVYEKKLLSPYVFPLKKSYKLRFKNK
jgi:hypothetical protein